MTVGSIAILAAKGGLFTIANGGDYRVFGPPESFIADNNDFALATILIIPMLHFLQLQLKRPWMRHGMTVVTLLCVASVLGSHSRGGLLALVAMGGIFWLRSSRKGLFGVLGIIGAIVLLPIMPQDWWERMGTIGTYTQDESAMGRINAWYVAIDTAQQYFFGAGMSYQYQSLFDEYGRWETIVRAAHSIYFQILGNHGFVGLFIFLMIWITGYRSASWLARSAERHPEAEWAAQLGRMASASIAGYAVGGAFLSLPYFDLPYNVLIMVVLARKWVVTKAWEKEQATPATPNPTPAIESGGPRPVTGGLRRLREHAPPSAPQRR